MKSYYVVGCYTHFVPHAALANGSGISVIQLDEDLGAIKIISCVQDVKNPSYLCYRSDINTVLSVSEDEENGGGEVLSFSLDKNYSLDLLSRSTNGDNSSCHLISYKDRVFTASYVNGSIADYKLENKKARLISNYKYSGTGPNLSRQEAPHAHQVVLTPDKNLYVVDLGTDSIWKHHIQDGLNSCTLALKVPTGYGPRHMALDKDNKHLYILCELIPRILVVKIEDDGQLTIIQDIPSIEPDKETISAPAAIKIHPSGNSLAASNRFDDTIGVFSITRNDQDVTITLNSIISSGGKTPRDIEFSSSGKWLLIANQDSSNIQLKEFDKERGLPLAKSISGIAIGTPVCIVNLN
ncbi:MAG: lactonase family protein [Spirochaetaceae bacterium]